VYRDKQYYFSPFEFTSDIFKSQSPLALKTLVVEILEVDKKDPKKVKVAGRTQFLLRDALKNHEEKGKKITLFILDEKNRYKGKFEVHNCSARRYYTFFDLVFRN
jgi:hypothetical protein